jgi:preprotein translocase SecE subunit
MALRFYKHGQGKLSRGLTAFGVGLLGMFACYSLYNWLGSFDAFKKPLEGWPSVLGPDVPVNLALVISAGLFIAIGVGIYFLANWPKATDFLLETEAELKKVSWPSAREVYGSSVVVLVVVTLLGLYILGVDFLLGNLRDWGGSLLGKLFGN